MASGCDGYKEGLDNVAFVPFLCVLQEHLGDHYVKEDGGLDQLFGYIR